MTAALAMGIALMAANEHDQKFYAFFQKHLDESFARHPFDASSLGDHRFDDRLDDLTPEARAKDFEILKRTREALDRDFEYPKMSRPAQIDLGIFRSDLDRTLWLQSNQKAFEEDPRVYNLYINDSVYLLLVQSTVAKPITLRNCAARMGEIPRIVASAKRNLRNPPRVFVETAIRQNRGAIAFYEGGVFEAAGETPQLSILAPAAKRAVAALQDYQTFLEKELLARASGEWRIGKEKFAKKLELELDAGLTADQVLAEAESEFARVEREMYVVARQLWYRRCPGAPLPPDDEAGRRECVQRVMASLAKETGTASTLVADINKVAENVRKFISTKGVLNLPSPDKCKIIEMPEFQRGNTIAYLNPAPPLDPRADSIYAISPPPKDWTHARAATFFEEYNRYMLQILTIHEAYPGHYVQLEYSNRHPSPVRKVLQSGVFAEGWAVYTEQMMLDQGYGDGDLGLRLNQLKFYLRAVCNAILDNKMHTAGMTDEEAMKLLVDRSFQSEAEARLKVIRAKQSSCQLSTYFVGRTAFYRLRQAVQRELGAKFDLGRYHEAVLDHGTLPVKYLPELVRERLSQPR